MIVQNQVPSNMKNLTAFFLLFLLAGWLCAQPMEAYTFRHLGPEQGLAGNTVTNMLQDSRGYLWMSCGADGLQRYDGERFLLFQHDPGDSTSIPYGGAGGLMEDSRSTIWCAAGPKHIVAAYDPDTRRFRRLYHQGKPVEGAYQFFEIQGKIHILTWSGVIRLDSTGKRVEQIVSAVSNYYLMGTYDEASRAIWFWNDQGYHCLDVTTGELYHAKHNPHHWKLLEDVPQDHGPRALFCDHQGRIWISDWNFDGYCFDPKNNTLARYKNGTWGAGSVSQFIEDDHKRLWTISNDSRLCRYVPEQDTFMPLFAQNENPYAYHSGSSGEEYPAATKDLEGYFWVGNDAGIHIFHPTRQTVRTIRDDSAPLHERSTVNDILQAANGDIYVSHWHGRVQRLDSTLQEKAIYRNTAQRKFWQTAGLYSVAQDLRGRIWVGEERGWISLLDAEGRKLAPMRCKPCGESKVRNIVWASDGDMWTDLAKPAIAHWDSKTEQFEVFDTPLRKPAYQTYAILEDNNGKIWTGSDGQGIFCFDPMERKFTAAHYDSTSKETALSDNTINALLQLGTDTLLVGTEHGLKCLDLENKTYRPHPLSSGFTNSGIYAMLQDKRGNVWVTTSKGVFCADRALTHLRRFGVSDGFVDDKFLLRGFVLLRDGRIAAGTYEGNLVVFHPDSLLRAKPPLPAPVVTDFQVFSQGWLIDSLLRRGQPVVLDHKQNAVAVFYGVLSYSRSDVTYRYRLAGLSDRWIDVGKRREVYFSYLLPGAYTFEVQALGQGGDVSPVTAFPLIIRPPWWRTAWFYALIGLALLALAYAVARDRIRRFRERTTYQKRLSDLENQALRAQINPHFIFNALQAVKLFVLQNDVPQAEHYMSRFARLMRQIMDNSRQSNVPLRQELDLLDNYLLLEQLRFGHAWDYRFEFDDAVQAEEISVPSMTLQPFVENAVLHGLAHLRSERRGLLTVRCSMLDGGLLIAVEDNGVGRARAEGMKNTLRREHHRSAGLDITSRRLALFSEGAAQPARYTVFDLTDETGAGCGTRVEVWLPGEGE